MPRGDRRGPEGFGAMTGRALGYCAGNDRPGFAVDAAPQRMARGFRGGGRGRGPGRGMGYGRGFGRGYRALSSENQETNNTEQSEAVSNNELALNRLENIAENLQSQLEEVKGEINNLKEE